MLHQSDQKFPSLQSELSKDDDDEFSSDKSEDWLCDFESDSSFQGFSIVTSDDEVKTDSEEMSDD